MSDSTPAGRAMKHSMWTDCSKGKPGTPAASRSPVCRESNDAPSQAPAFWQTLSLNTPLNAGASLGGELLRALRAAGIRAEVAPAAEDPGNPALIVPEEDKEAAIEILLQTLLHPEKSSGHSIDDVRELAA